MSENEINFKQDHEDTSGHGFKIPAPAAIDDTDDNDDNDDTEGNTARVHPAPSAKDADDTQGHGARVHP